MASVPPSDLPDQGPIEAPEPTQMPSEVGPMPGDIDQPSPDTSPVVQQ